MQEQLAVRLDRRRVREASKHDASTKSKARRKRARARVRGTAALLSVHREEAARAGMEAAMHESGVAAPLELPRRRRVAPDRTADREQRAHLAAEHSPLHELPLALAHLSLALCEIGLAPGDVRRERVVARERRRGEREAPVGGVASRWRRLYAVWWKRWCGSRHGRNLSSLASPDRGRGLAGGLRRCIFFSTTAVSLLPAAATCCCACAHSRPLRLAGSGRGRLLVARRRRRRGRLLVARAGVRRPVAPCRPDRGRAEACAASRRRTARCSNSAPVHGSRQRKNRAPREPAQRAHARRERDARGRFQQGEGADELGGRADPGAQA